MKRKRSPALHVSLVMVGLLLGAALPAFAQPSDTSNVEPPRNIKFRDTFLNRNGDVLSTNVARPDSIVFRDVFLSREGDQPLDDAVPAPSGIVFRNRFLDRDAETPLDDAVPSPRGITFRPLFLARDGQVLVDAVDPPEGVVFRDPFLGREGPATGVDDAPPLRLLERASVLPNPFNPSTQISFRLTKEADVSVAVYDARGRRVRVLHRGTLAADAHVMRWDGTDDVGAPVGSGVYLVRIAAEEETIVVKGVLVE